MDHPIVEVKPLGFPWETADPFLFCVHHGDFYRCGNAQLGPAAPRLRAAKSDRIAPARTAGACTMARWFPGFRRDPHRGFETVTVVRRGLIEHSDSLGATARFGAGDVQWLTARRGIAHAEMFPWSTRPTRTRWSSSKSGSICPPGTR